MLSLFLPVYLSSFPFPPRVMYNLDEEESQGGIAINLLPLLAKEVQNKAEQHGQTTKAHKSVLLPPLPNSIYKNIRFTISVHYGNSNPNPINEILDLLILSRNVSPLCLSPFFRLLRLCEEKQHQGDLEEIDALLGEEEVTDLL